MNPERIELARCLTCLVLIAPWRTLCTRCALEISEDWPDVDDEPTEPGVRVTLVAR
jgi:hypothetical protein